MKRKLLKGFLSLIICGSMMMGLFSEPLWKVSAVSQETQDEIDKAEEEKDRLEQELEEQEENKDKLEDNKATAEDKLKHLKEQYESIASDLEALEEKRVQKEAEIEAKTAELEEAVAAQKKQYEDMKKRIRYMYENSQDSLFVLLFENHSIVEIINRVDSTMQLQEYDRKQLEEITIHAEQMDRQKKDLEAAKADLEILIAETQAQQAKVSALQKETNASIKDYLNQIAAAKEEIGDTVAELEAKTRELNALRAKAEAERLQEAIANGTIKPEDSGIVYGELNLTQSEIDMLTAIIYCESRGESYEGQLAVGYVVMNRVRSTKFAQNTVEAIIRAPKQFSPVGSGYFDVVLAAYWGGIAGVIHESSWESCQRAALECVNSASNVGESLFFRTHKPVPQLAENLAAAGVPYWIIGNHIFYYSWVNY